MIFECRYNECKAKCCKHLKGATGDAEYDLDKIRHVHLTVEPDDASISVTGEEKKILEKEAEKLGIKAEFKPLKIIVTSESEPLVLKWQIEHQVCPFLKSDDSCAVYDNRPLICRAFPLIPKSIHSVKHLRLVEKASFCPYTKGVEIRNWKVNPDNTEREYHEWFGEAFESYQKVGEINRRIESAVERMARDGRILNIKTRTAIRILENYKEPLQSISC